MRVRSVLAAAVVVALVPMLAAPMAQAYDRAAYEYAAGHMIDRADIPASLGKFDSRMHFSADPGNAVFLCYVPTAEPDASGLDVKGPKPVNQFSANFNTKSDGGSSLSVQVLQYPSATAAIKAFDTMKSKSKACNGTGSSTWTDDDGTAYTSSWSVSTSTVPAVAVVGVASLGITQDNLSQNSSSDDRYLNDNYTVYSLVNDVIIQTAYYANGPKNLTTAQRKSVNQVAFNAIGRWVG